MMNKDEALKHHAEKYGVSLEQFKIMCNNASKHYENQGMNSVDYGLAREAYFAGFTDACKEALEQPAQTYIVNNTASTKFRLYEQPAQEPVAWTTDGQIEWLSNKLNNTSVMWNNKDHERMGIKKECKIIPLYTHPHQWQGLTDDEIQELTHDGVADEYDIKFARAILAKAKEKNYYGPT